MAHGTPDWGVTAGARTIYRLTDLGELAARLGSPITHDRRGDVVWWDDFEWSLNKWVATLAGAGAAAAASGVIARNGQMSCLLTGGSNGGRYAEISHAQAYLDVGRGGAEISMHLPDLIEYFEVQLQMQDDSALVDLYLHYDHTLTAIRYLDSGSNYVTIATVPSLLTATGLFHTFKIVGDVDSRQYVRAIVDSHEYDLRGINAPVSIAANPPQMRIIARAGSRAANNDQAYVDDAILTINEPA